MKLHQLNPNGDIVTEAVTDDAEIKTFIDTMGYELGSEEYESMYHTLKTMKKRNPEKYKKAINWE